MLKQALEVDFTKHLGKFEKVLKNNDMIIEEILGIEAVIVRADEQEPDELIRFGSLGIPTGRYYEITGKILVPFS